GDERRAALWANLGDIHRELLMSMERATTNYAHALSILPTDAVARRGLSLLQAHPALRSGALPGLSRAFVASSEWDHAAELASGLGADEEVPADIGRSFWWGVACFQRDVRKDAGAAEAALQRALSFEPNSVQILEALSAIQGRAPGKSWIET